MEVSEMMLFIWVWIHKPVNEMVREAMIIFSFKEIDVVLNKDKPLVISRKQVNRVFKIGIDVIVGIKLKKIIVPKIISKVVRDFWIAEIILVDKGIFW